MKRLFLLPLLAGALLLTSCLGSSIHTTFKADGSGTVVMEFKISQMFYQMGAGDSEGASAVPLSAEQIREELGSQEGVTLREVTEEPGEEFTIIRAVMDFENYAVMSTADMLDGSVLTKNGNTWTYRQVIAEASEPSEESEPMDEEQLAMMAPYFDGYEIRFTVTAPRKVKSYSLGELSADGKTVSWAVPTLEMNTLQNTEDLVMEITW